MKYGNRSSWRRVISSPLTLVVITVVFVVLVRAAWGIYRKAGLSQTKLEQSQAELAKLLNRESDLTQKVSFLSTEAGLESEIRSKYRAVKQGESVAVIVDKSETASAADASSTIDLAPAMSWWSRLLQAIGL